jgi:hypothetical protein
MLIDSNAYSYIFIGSPITTAPCLSLSSESARSSFSSSFDDAAQQAHLQREVAKRNALEARLRAENAKQDASTAIEMYEMQEQQRQEALLQKEEQLRQKRIDQERMVIERQRQDAIQCREKAERTAREAKERAEALRLQAQSAISNYEAQQRERLKREESKKQMEIERKRREQLELAEQARKRREEAERQVKEAQETAARLRAQALAAQQELERQEQLRKQKELQREESRRLREEAQRREENRIKAEENERQAFEAKKEAERLRLEALRLSSQAKLGSGSCNGNILQSSVSSSSLSDSDTCVICKASMKSSQKFCLQCGTKRAVASTPAQAPLSSLSDNLFGALSSPSSTATSSPSPYSTPRSSLVSLGESSNSLSCTICKAAIKPSQKFCLNCGAGVAQSVPSASATINNGPISIPSNIVMSSPPVPLPAPIPVFPSSCVSCQIALKIGQRFCLQCGTKVSEIPPAPASSSASLSRQDSSKICKSCRLSCKASVKYCMRCGFNFAQSDQAEVDRNVALAHQRQQAARAEEFQQRNQASMLASAAQARNTQFSSQYNLF